MITAPYNFVPLSRKVVFTEWADQVSHDMPFKDGISGSIVCKLTTVSPIYVRNGGNWTHDDIMGNAEAQSFFKIGETYIIPGSSLKGMLRNLIEIISFGKMKQVDNRKYSIRDLYNWDIYGHLFTGGDKVNGFRARPKAAWLSEEDGKWYLTPCEYARIEQNDLIEYHRGRPDLKRKQLIEDKYSSWEPKSLQVEFDCDKADSRYRHSCGALIYKKASNLRSGNRGTIVFTGQPGDNESRVRLNVLPNDIRFSVKQKERILFLRNEGTLVFKGVMSENEKRSFLELSSDRDYQIAIEKLFEACLKTNKSRTKHMEFIFFNDDGKKKNKVRKTLKEEFEFIHSVNNEPNDDWKYWKSRLKEGRMVPVFYLGNISNPDSMGLSLMYRLPYTNSIHDTIAHTNPDHISPYKDRRQLDLAETMFGFADEGDGLKGRVFVCAAKLENARESAQCPPTVLGGPKPTYFPIYIKQKTDNSGRVTGYKTFMDNDCEIRGWKRYPARLQNAVNIPPASPEQVKVATKFTPLEPGAISVFHIKFHNLQPVELGVLVWALTWGGRENLCHSLGMAKPFGLGQVKIKIDKATLSFASGQPDSEMDQTKLLKSYGKDFENWMDTKLSERLEPNKVQWFETEQMAQLLAMANPEHLPEAEQRRKLKYMVLGQGRDGNQFVTARRDDRTALAPFAKFTGTLDEDLFGKLPRDSKKLAPKAPSDVVQTEVPEIKGVLARFDSIKNLNNKQKLFSFFQVLKPSDMLELDKTDFSCLNSVLNIGVVDELQNLEASKEIKSFVARKMLEYIEPKRQWDAGKMVKYNKLKSLMDRVE